jgi:hypothetical protein
MPGCGTKGKDKGSAYLSRVTLVAYVMGMEQCNR